MLTPEPAGDQVPFHFLEPQSLRSRFYRAGSERVTTKEFRFHPSSFTLHTFTWMSMS